MNKSAIIDTIKSSEAAIRARGARALYLFGSVRHGRSRPDSDVDVLIDYDPTKKFSLIDLVAIKHLIEDRIQRPVDLLTRDGIDRRLRERILADAEQVF
ncbi:MAG: nucleotidyltransferase domain-containing protein [Rhodospirillaceae bacterium]|nr:nucleotidyltransferase domain-containing protein [Rhodospirillaceae bacterium]